MKNIEPITTSVFDLFKIGPGPSSSHTIGPMRAGACFLEDMAKLSDKKLAKADSVEAHLFGSLSSTGKGHGTDRSVLAGLLGWEPKSCDPEAFSDLLSQKDKEYFIRAKEFLIKFTAKDIYFDDVATDLPFPNTLIFKLKEADKVILEKEYYSIGGGFIKCKGEKEPPPPKPAFSYTSMSDLKKLLKKSNLNIAEFILENEKAVTGASAKNIYSGLDEIMNAMCEAVSRGINSNGVLPGPIKLSRKAPELYRRAARLDKDNPDRFLAFLNAYALAASEENAAGHKVVTAPTSGSAGVIPAVVYLLKHHFYMLNRELADGLLAAASIGFIAKHNASISGAEVGCQGEVGVASAMAAALVAYVNGHSARVVENAAEIALEHHLGMTCDPVDGYVQIPCIERNAVGAIDAYNAYLLASIGDPHKQKVTFDEVVKAMLETGRDMCDKYKETAKGGLAVCSITC
jgi:L-serine dehydratase